MSDKKPEDSRVVLTPDRRYYIVIAAHEDKKTMWDSVTFEDTPELALSVAKDRSLRDDCVCAEAYAAVLIPEDLGSGIPDPGQYRKRFSGGSVFIAYYHPGFHDEGPTVLDVCESEAVALVVIEEHKRGGDRDYENEGKASWWVEERGVRTADDLKPVKLSPDSNAEAQGRSKT